MPARQNESENCWLPKPSASRNECKLEVISCAEHHGQPEGTKMKVDGCAKHQGQPIWRKLLKESLSESMSDDPIIVW